MEYFGNLVVKVGYQRQTSDLVTIYATGKAYLTSQSCSLKKHEYKLLLIFRKLIV